MVDRSSFARPANLAEASLPIKSTPLQAQRLCNIELSAAGHRQIEEEYKLLQGQLSGGHCVNHCCDHGNQSQISDSVGSVGTSVAISVRD